ncbi:MAG: carboxymuconolactone decarboxylase family protein [Syntrophales bacterium]|nr:carboxymuconolactone decarboxylase family protein [Syntrophales bacterium]MDD5643325.1 carboxymuconolactone decarboxylase family protein [Syntrophales bacterium]
MPEKSFPPWYNFIKKNHPGFLEAVEGLGERVRQAGPLEAKTSHLIQLAAAAAIRSQGSVHSHTRRALQAGASPEEIIHALVLLTSTIGFPNVSAALSWAYDVMGQK